MELEDFHNVGYIILGRGTVFISVKARYEHWYPPCYIIALLSTAVHIL